MSAKFCTDPPDFCACGCGIMVPTRLPSRPQNKYVSASHAGKHHHKMHERKPKPIPGSILFDEQDREMLAGYTWFINQGYAMAHVRGSRRKVAMHRLIMQPGLGIQVDHINGDRADNRRSNLRVVQAIQNAQNRKVRKDNPTGKRGVFWNKRDGCYYAGGTKDGKRVHIGCFRTLEIAAHAAKCWRAENMPGNIDR